MCWGKLGALNIDTKVNLTRLMYLMDSLLSPQFPVLLASPEQSHTNPTAKNFPGLNNPSWFLYLQMSFCSFLRLQLSVVTNLLNSMRTGQSL